MSASGKITLSGLPRAELEALTERLLAENAALTRAVAELRAEVAALKGLKGRPEVRPSGMEKATEPEPAGTGRGRGARGSKSARLTVHEERVIAAEVPREHRRAFSLTRASSSSTVEPRNGGCPRILG